MLITIGILVVLGVFAAGSRRGEDVGATSSLGGGRGVSMAPEMAADAYINPLDPVPKAEWEVLTGCELIETPTNAAHYFRVKRDSKPMVFRLYFVEAPELTDPDEDAVAEHARYFAWPAAWEPEECADRSVRLGQQAWQEVENLLKGRPFMVLTKFELHRDTHHFYALVLIEDADGRRRTLQEWLVERGYAMITRPELGWLPIRTSSAEFLERLEGLQHAAQRERRGGWGVAGRP